MTDDSALPWLALARGDLDRRAELRRDEDRLAEMWKDPRARVLVVEDGRTLVASTPEPALITVAPADAPPGDPWYLGSADDGVPYFAVAGPLPDVEGADRGGLRRLGALLSDRDSGLLTHAVALANWHAANRFCPRCGTETVVAAAGHVRVCPNDGGEHYPRLDPAVIMLVRDDADRVLLARGPQWPADRRSILAGFVEPGESLEQAVAREVREEVGVGVRDVEYLGSQPWPLPQSLMLGFFARLDGPADLVLDGAEISDAGWYGRDELRAAVESGEIVTPGAVSIAAQLIERWYGGPLPQTRAF
ncbi:NAD(+) diphosphatase [Actinomadura atramentaria]|uniref:NAD(+) diphosphatase n=1 Tax=Actinomadura atramentaria TaxID=1990 RepID=UPI000371356A|nr:NAD(+) diphosphatase [Actinomadura atramentaria]